jgi:hypothetical protein
MGKLPVLFLTFNKVEPTQRVLQAIAAYQPEVLYVAQDGPRPGNAGDVDKVQGVWEVLQTIEWPCEVIYRKQEENQGLRVHVEGAITWFFEHVPEGIILEDDTLPTADFFPFCEELIERYREDKRVFLVGGTNLNLPADTPYSYFFCPHPIIWGWAGWANRWAYYDSDMGQMAEAFADGSAELLYPDPFLRETEHKKIMELRHNRLQSWAARWGYTLKVQNGLCVVPKTNLVTNIGFGYEATNTHDATHPHANLQLEKQTWPLVHPSHLARNRAWENRFFYPGQAMHQYLSLGELLAMVRRKVMTKVKKA